MWQNTTHGCRRKLAMQASVLYQLMLEVPRKKKTNAGSEWTVLQ
jgi:hypothetical protein